MGSWYSFSKRKNLVTLANIAWRLIHNSNNPWLKILSSIYSSSKNFKNTSLFGKSMVKKWEICNNGLKWILHTNSIMNIWDSNWIPKSPNLRQLVEGPLPISCNNLTIKDIWINNNWELNKIFFDLPQDKQ